MFWATKEAGEGSPAIQDEVRSFRSYRYRTFCALDGDRLRQNDGRREQEPVLVLTIRPISHLCGAVLPNSTHPYVLCSARSLVLHIMEEDLRTQAAPGRTFTSTENLVEMIRRGSGFKDFASKQAVEHAIQAGRGNVDLLLTEDLYNKLARKA